MWPRAVASALLIALLAGCGDDDDSSASGTGRFAAERAFADLEAQVAIGQRPAGSAASRETARLIADRLRDAGAQGVGIQRPWRNVVATIPGTDRGEAVVVGAHHDTKDDVGRGFEGANDSASGVAVVLELARVLPRPMPGPTIHLALFDAEEARGDRPFDVDGTRGSRQYLAYARRGEQGSPPLERIEAMVLFDLVGDCDLQIPLEANSDPDLYRAFAEAAKDVDGDAAPFEGTTSAISDDHIPFLAAGIPVVDVIDFTFGPGPAPGAYWHTPEDTLDKVCPESLEAVGEAAVRVLTGTY